MTNSNTAVFKQNRPFFPGVVFFRKFHSRLLEKPWLFFALLVIFGVVIRFFASGVRVFVSPDSMAYWYTTEAILNGDWINTYIERTPGYPLLLMPVQWVTAAVQPFTGGQDAQDVFQRVLLLFQTFLGITNALLLSNCVKRLSQNVVLAFYAGLAMLLLPDLLLYEHAFLSETLYTTGLLLWFRCFLSCKRLMDIIKLGTIPVSPKNYLLKIALLGLLSGWLMLVKPIAISVAVCAVIWFCVGRRFLVQTLLVFCLSLGAFVLPWAIMNANVHGTFTLAAGKGANQLYKMIDEVDWTSPLAGEYKILLHQRYLIHPEGETYNAVNDVHVLMDKQAKRKPDYSTIYLKHDEDAGMVAFEAIIRHPFAWVYQTLKQWVDFFVKPSGPIVRLPIFFVWSIVSSNVWQCLMLLGGLGAIMAFYYRNTAMLMALSLILGHSVFYALSTLMDARYHIPLEPFVLLLAVYLVGLLTTDPAEDRQAVFLAP